MTDRHEITVTVNGRCHEAIVEGRRTLADFLRVQCGLTGTHVGCEHGACGACTVVVDGRAVRSCLFFAVQADGAEVLTIEGLAPSPDELHPIQAAFKEEHALQCGFCTPGFIMTLHALLEENPSPTRPELVDGLTGNLCRCTGYQGILRAAERAAGLA